MASSKEEIITELYRRTRMSVDPKDPIFLVVELNNILLEKHSDLIAERVSVVADGFERTSQRGADELIEAINKASSVLQSQLVIFEASAQKISVPEYLKVQNQTAAGDLPKQGSDAEFKERFEKAIIYVVVFGAGLVLGLLIAGFMWVFFR